MTTQVTWKVTVYITSDEHPQRGLYNGYFYYGHVILYSTSVYDTPHKFHYLGDLLKKVYGILFGEDGDVVSQY